MNAQLAVWCVATATILCILVRPWNISEAWWACAGALLLLLARVIPLDRAERAVAEGTDVYLFLTGMMLLAELARREGVFDWLAGLATRSARGSSEKLFALVYGVGIVVTVFLSNDATAVVLTPAVFAVVKKARAQPLPYLFACAFIANAASFVLPISNPANLVVFRQNMPPLGQWLATFGLPSLLSIALTYAALRFLSRKDLAGAIAENIEAPRLSAEGRLAAYGIAGSAICLMIASARGAALGLPTCAAAVIATLAVTLRDRNAVLGIAREVSWSVIPLVGGLFVIVEALNGAGALRWAEGALLKCMTWPALQGKLAAAFGVAALSNLMNNLPAGLISGKAVSAVHVSSSMAGALLIGVDLGPNLSVTGSLATILWLIALRRENLHLDAWTFLKAGMVVMPPALLLAVGALSITT